MYLFIILSFSFSVSAPDSDSASVCFFLTLHLSLFHPLLLFFSSSSFVFPFFLLSSSFSFLETINSFYNVVIFLVFCFLLHLSLLHHFSRFFLLFTASPPHSSYFYFPLHQFFLTCSGAPLCMELKAQHLSLKTLPSCSTSSLDGTSRLDNVALGLTTWSVGSVGGVWYCGYDGRYGVRYSGS